MTIEPGGRLPAGTLLRMGREGVEAVATGPLFSGRRVVMFGVPGAFSGLCASAHVPSYMRVMARLSSRGVDAILCVAVNDPWVMAAWGDASGAASAGITMLADPSGDWTEALGQSFTAPEVGLYRRCRRFSALVEDGVVRLWQEEASHGVCEATAGEAMLAAIG